MGLCVWAAVALLGCSGEPAPFDALWGETTSRVSTPTTTTLGVDGQQIVHQRPHLMDAQGRYVHVYGINVSGSHKAPPTEEFPSRFPLSDDPACRCAQSCQANDVACVAECAMPPDPGCVLSQDVSYVGSPFPLEEADHWFGTLARLGFNAVRLVTNWESIQPYAPGSCDDRPGNYTEECYDLDYLDYYEAIVTKAEDYGIYVLVDMHQDVFSRHLMGYYRENPWYIHDDTGETVQTEPGSMDALVLSLFPPYTDWVRGHGAPRWVVQTCLPEKNMDSPYWGMNRIIGALLDENGNPDLGLMFDQLGGLFERFFPGGDLPPWLGYISLQLPLERFEVQDTSDFLPLSPWVLPGVLSLDSDRCYAALFAGDTVYPDLVVDQGVTRRRTDDDSADLPGLGTYLQTAYADAFRQVAERTRQHDNILGYDLMNEPMGIFLMLTLASGYVQSGGPDTLLGLLVSLLPAEEGELLDPTLPSTPPTETGEKAYWLSQCASLACDLYVLIRDLALIPPDTEPETLEAWGLADVDVLAALGLNLGFEVNQLQPFYEFVGQAIQEVDEDAVIWIEPASSLRMITGTSQFFDMPLTRPQGLNQVVYAPHWYPDIYPLPGINGPPREFNADEWLYRDFKADLAKHMDEAPTWLGNVPVVFGEFGTYWNFGGLAASQASGYAISSHILDSYYRAFEELGIGHMVWCFAPDNDAVYGEHWNHEDFSLIDSDGAPRGWAAYVRTHARSTSGKLVSQRFHSQFRFWDPSHGEPPPDRTYTLTMETHEAEAPTEIFVPSTIATAPDWSAVQYPDGFYVWLSDGAAFHDSARQILYWYPTRDEPGTLHTLRIEPALPDREALGWSYYFEGEHTLVGTGDATTTGLSLMP